MKLLKEYAAVQGFTVAQQYVDVETAKQTGRSARNMPALAVGAAQITACLRPGVAPSVWSQHRSVIGAKSTYPVDTEAVEAPSLPLHKLADSVVGHGRSEGKSGLAAQQLHLPGCKLAIVLGAGFSLPSTGPDIPPTKRRTVGRGLPLLV
jgi:hypothetical protein